MVHPLLHTQQHAQSTCAPVEEQDEALVDQVDLESEIETIKHNGTDLTAQFEKAVLLTEFRSETLSIN